MTKRKALAVPYEDEDADDNDSVHARGIYTTLDSLLDTRASVLETHWPGVIEPLLLDGKYHTRASDTFPPVTHAEFKAKYDQRTHEDLKHAVVTPVLSLIRDAVRCFQHEILVQGFRSTPRLFINTWPYLFTKEWCEEFAQFIGLGITGPNLLKVKVFYRTPEEVSTTWVNRFVNVMYDYHGLDWMEAQTKNFQVQTVAHVPLYIPAIDLTGQHTHESMKEMEEREGVHPIVDLENAATPLIKLQQLFVHNFSIVSPKFTPVF